MHFFYLLNSILGYFNCGSLSLFQDDFFLFNILSKSSGEWNVFCFLFLILFKWLLVSFLFRLTINNSLIFSFRFRCNPIYNSIWIFSYNFLPLELVFRIVHFNGFFWLRGWCDTLWLCICQCLHLFNWLLFTRSGPIL